MAMILACYGGGEGSYYRAILNEADVPYYPICMHSLDIYRMVYCYECLTEEKRLVLETYHPDSDVYQKIAKRLYEQNIYYSVAGLI